MSGRYCSVLFGGVPMMARVPPDGPVVAPAPVPWPGRAAGAVAACPRPAPRRPGPPAGPRRRGPRPGFAAGRAQPQLVPSGVRAKSAAIEVASTGRLLWSRDLNTERPMASITKVMTALRRDQGGRPGPEDHRPVRRGRVRDASTTPATPACGRGTSSPPASFSTGCCCPSGRRRRLRPGRGLRSGYPGVHHQDERHREAAGHEPDALQQLRRACPIRRRTRTTPPPRTCSPSAASR